MGLKYSDKKYLDNQAHFNFHANVRIKDEENSLMGLSCCEGRGWINSCNITVCWLKPSSDRVHCSSNTFCVHLQRKPNGQFCVRSHLEIHKYCARRRELPQSRKQTTISLVFPPFSKLWPWSNQSTFFWLKCQGNFKNWFSHIPVQR